MDQAPSTSYTIQYVVPLKYQLQDPRETPLFKEPGNAGYDLKALETKIISPWGREVFNTGIVVELPPNTYGRIAPRSGIALTFGLNVGGGVIDENFRRQVGVILFNYTEFYYGVTAGDKIAQLIVEKIENTVPVQI